MSPPFFPHPVQMLIFSCKLLNSKWLLRDVHRTLLFQQKSKETPTFVPPYSDPLTKERKLRPDTSNFKTHTHKENPQKLSGKKQPYYYRLIFIDNGLQVNTLLLKTGYNNMYKNNVVQTFS